MLSVTVVGWATQAAGNALAIANSAIFAIPRCIFWISCRKHIEAMPIITLHRIVAVKRGNAYLSENRIQRAEIFMHTFQAGFRFQRNIAGLRTRSPSGTWGWRKNSTERWKTDAP